MKLQPCPDCGHLNPPDAHRCHDCHLPFREPPVRPVEAPWRMPAIPGLRIGAGVTLALAIVASLFAAWYYWPAPQFAEDGSHIAVTEFLRAALVDDPNDYEHIETHAWDHPDGFLMVSTWFHRKKAGAGWVNLAVDRRGRIKNIFFASNKQILDRLNNYLAEHP